MTVYSNVSKCLSRIKSRHDHKMFNLNKTTNDFQSQSHHNLQIITHVFFSEGHYGHFLSPASAHTG